MDDERCLTDAELAEVTAGYTYDRGSGYVAYATGTHDDQILLLNVNLRLIKVFDSRDAYDKWVNTPGNLRDFLRQ